jgi:hypothetical protein
MPITLPYGPVLTVEAALSAATGQAAVLNSNPTFEAGISPWVPRNSTIAQSSAWAQQGTYSMQITPDGVSLLAYAESEAIPVIAGQRYTAAGVVNSSGVWSGGFSFSVNWFASPGGAYISTSSASFALTTGVQSRSNSFTAPVGATVATLVPTLGGTPPSSQVIWVDLVTLSSTTVGFGAWDTAVWDTALWGPDEIWADISPWVRSVNTDRRFDRTMQAWESGAATISLNNQDARFSPANLGGPYVSYGITSIRPWRPVRIRATWAGVTYDLYKGYAVSWKEVYDQPSPNGGGAYMTVSCVDEMDALARVDGLAQTPVGSGELSGPRIHRVLNIAGHTGTRVVDVGNVTMQATDLSQNTVQELRLTADSEGGGLYIDRAGAVVFERSTALVENGRSNTIQAVYGDGPGELPYSAVEPAYDGDLMVNIVSWSRTGGATQTATDEISRALDKDKRDTSKTNLMCSTDAQVATLAQFFIQRFSKPEDRIASVTIKPRNNPAVLFPAVLSREVRDLVRARRRPPGGITITRDCHIAGISHEITDENWVTTFTLWSASVYQGVARWDVATYDTSTYFF